jgi:potassium inwardly-rectifying channel subfamily J
VPSSFSFSRSDRIVFKHGDVNTIMLGVGRRYKRYFKDIFTSVIDAQWRHTLTIFACSFVTSWTVFACLWYAMAVAHGDIEFYEKWLHAPDQGLFERENRMPCVRNLYNFASAFLFSIETQHTIGLIKFLFLRIISLLIRCVCVSLCRVWVSTSHRRLCR